jgi:hypothetical protein
MVYLIWVLKNGQRLNRNRTGGHRSIRKRASTGFLAAALNDCATLPII